VSMSERLRRLEEKAAVRNRQNAGPVVILVFPDSTAGRPEIDGFHKMTQSQADAYRSELAERGQRGPIFISFSARDLDL
jgi:hypothetical protein